MPVHTDQRPTKEVPSYTQRLADREVELNDGLDDFSGSEYDNCKIKET